MSDKLLPYESEPHKQAPPLVLQRRMGHDDIKYQDILSEGLPEHDHTKQKKIAVVGAGMAGLVSGWLLKRAGHDVTIFESSNTVGGRVRTLRKGFSAGYYAEAGAMRIPSHHKLTRHLLERSGLIETTLEFPNSSPNAYYYINQQRVRRKEYENDPRLLGDKFALRLFEQNLTATRLLHVCLSNYVREDEVLKNLIPNLPDDTVPEEKEDPEQRHNREREQFGTLVSTILDKHEAVMEIDKISLQPQHPSVFARMV